MSVWVVLKILKKDCQAEKSFMVCWQVKNSDKEYEHIVKFWDRFEMKVMKDYHNLCLKCDTLLLADVFYKFKNSE